MNDDIKRYDHNKKCDCYGMIFADDGEFVLYDDYAALIARVQEITNDRDEWKVASKLWEADARGDVFQHASPLRKEMEQRIAELERENAEINGKYTAACITIRDLERDNAEIKEHVIDVERNVIMRRDAIEQARRETWKFCGNCLKEGGVSIDFPSYDDAMAAFNFGKSLAQQRKSK